MDKMKLKSILITLGMFYILSLITNVLFWQSLPSNVVSKSLFGAFAVLFEITKYISAHMFFKKKVSLLTKGTSIGLYLILGLASIFGTYFLLENWHLDAQLKSRAQSEQYLLVSKNIQIQEEKIRTLQTLVNDDIRLGYRSRAAETIKTISIEEEKLDIFSQNLAKIGNVSSNQFGTLYDKAVFVLLSVLLELTGFYLISIYHRNEVFLDKVISKPSPKVDLSPRMEEKYSQVKEKIQSGEVRPVVRDIRKHFNTGAANINRFMMRLLDEGIVIKKNNRFHLVAA